MKKPHCQITNVRRNIRGEIVGFRGGKNSALGAAELQLATVEKCERMAEITISPAERARELRCAEIMLADAAKWVAIAKACGAGGREYR